MNDLSISRSPLDPNLCASVLGVVRHRRQYCTSLVAVLYVTGGSVVAGLVPATVRR